jgi:dihydroorotate dehydrogenase
MSGVHDLASRTLSLLPPETAHKLAVAALAAGLGPKAQASPAILATNLAGMTLPNPIGLAAGFDKDAAAVNHLHAMGFGFVECGTVTPLAQKGNPRPRLFRLPQDQAVINRLGFNNRGLAPFAARLAGRRRAGVVGANVGANRDSADKIADYVTAVTRLWGSCDYFTLNISSPNTPGLRDLQAGAALEDLLGAVGEATAADRASRPTPIFLKVSPDIHESQIEEIVGAAVRHGLAGLVISNTTLERPASLRSPRRGEAGGLSGAPLMDRSTRLLAAFHVAAGGRLALIGVGGVMSGADAYAKIRAGAAAVQLYTGLALRGPGLVGRIGAQLAERLRVDGFENVAAAIGAT